LWHCNNIHVAATSANNNNYVSTLLIGITAKLWRCEILSVATKHSIHNLNMSRFVCQSY